MRDIESGHAYTVSSVSHYIWLSFQLVSLGVQYASRYFALMPSLYKPGGGKIEAW